MPWLTCQNCGVSFWHKRKDRTYCGKGCSSPINARKKKNTLQKEKEFIVWSCGGGVDSVGIASMIYQGMLERPDYAVMTDNGYDALYTWDYVNNIIKPKLLEVNVKLHIVKSSDYANMNIIVNDHVVLPAYAQYNKKTVKFNTKCSGTWKLAPFKKWLKNQGVKRCRNWVGVSADEKHRVKQSGLNWIKYEYPLVERNLSRRDCKRLIKKAGWPLPLRSSCVMCPQKTDDQWLDMRDDYPDEFQRAVNIEMEIHKTHPHVFLHRSLRPLADAIFVGGGDPYMKMAVSDTSSSGVNLEIFNPNIRSNKHKPRQLSLF